MNYIRIIIALLTIAVVSLPTAIVQANDVGYLPAMPIMGPRLDPPAIPHSSVLNPDTIYNNLLVPPGLPQPSIEADAANGGALQQKPGRFVKQTKTEVAEGLTLYPASGVCNDFNTEKQWASREQHPWADVWSDWYSGWAPFAVDGGFYRAKNVTFSMERAVGPGKNYGSGFSAKIASNQPYAAGFGSPRIKVDPWSDVTVRVKYLMVDHDHKGLDYDWASMGVKPDAAGEVAEYVNGYVRGEWAVLEHSVEAGNSGEIMVLLQGHSPGAFNSNIYFDDVQISVNGRYIQSCEFE